MSNIFVVIFKSILAGVSIGLGGFIYIASRWSFNNYITSYNEFGNVIGSDLFSIGLLLVCRFQLMLYTGKIGLTFESSQSAEYWVNIFIMLIFNISSAYALGMLANYLLSFWTNKSLLNTAIAIASGKTNCKTVNDYVKTSVQSIFCGTCVHIGVRCYQTVNGFSAFMLTNWFVFIFVYSGFQHCIANSFYFGIARLFNNDVYINVAICVVGNMLGTIPVALITKTFGKN